MRILARLLAAVTPKRIAATVFTLGALGAGAAPAVATFTAGAAPATSIAMHYEGPAAGPCMHYEIHCT
jgi:hypothetical protein